jgi:hypothetical protein
VLFRRLLHRRQQDTDPRFMAKSPLFPFGPKPLVLFTALEVARFYPEASWFIYPKPYYYDVDYTEGYGETLWFLPDGSTYPSR